MVRSIWSSREFHPNPIEFENFIPRSIYGAILSTINILFTLKRPKIKLKRHKVFIQMQYTMCVPITTSCSTKFWIEGKWQFSKCDASQKLELYFSSDKLCFIERLIDNNLIGCSILLVFLLKLLCCNVRKAIIMCWSSRDCESVCVKVSLHGWNFSINLSNNYQMKLKNFYLNANYDGFYRQKATNGCIELTSMQILSNAFAFSWHTDFLCTAHTSKICLTRIMNYMISFASRIISSENIINKKYYTTLRFSDVENAWNNLFCVFLKKKKRNLK